VSLVSLVDTRKSGHMKRAIEESLDLIGFKFSRNIRNVVIKPNMCYYWDYSTGETTDPKFVEVLVDLIRKQVSPKVNISIVESDASAMKCKYAFKFLGYEKMARKKGIDLVNLSKDKSERVEVVVGGQKLHFMAPQTILDADLRVNVPKIKYHPLTQISCALKNIYGCNPYQKKFRYHQKVDEVIVGLNKIMNFDLCVVDAIITFGSQPSKLGLVMAGLDQVAIDVVAAKLARINPRHIRHIMLAEEEGIGKASFVTMGASLKRFKEKFPRKNANWKIMRFGHQLVTKLGLSNRLSLTR